MLWRPQLTPVAVLLADAPDGFAGPQRRDLDALGPVLAEHTADDGRHVLLGGPEGEQQYWRLGPDTGRRLAVLLPLDEDLPLRLESARRLYRRLQGQPAGPPPRRWRLTPQQRRRFILMLRALDGYLAGASQRQLAIALFDTALKELRPADWSSSARRAQIMRLVADGVAQMNGGYRALLRGD